MHSYAFTLQFNFQAFSCNIHNYGWNLSTFGWVCGRLWWHPNHATWALIIPTQPIPTHHTTASMTSWVCNLCSCIRCGAPKGPDLILCCHLLELLNRFKTRGFIFSFSLNPANYTPDFSSDSAWEFPLTFTAPCQVHVGQRKGKVVTAPQIIQWDRLYVSQCSPEGSNSRHPLG